MALVTLDDVSMAYGHLPLLDRIALQVEAGERLCVLGRNGAGKSTLLRVLGGALAPDSGSVCRQPGSSSALLEQDGAYPCGHIVFDAVSEGLGGLGSLVGAYHRAATEVAERGSPAHLAKLGRLQHELEENDGWRLEQRVAAVLSRLKLPPGAAVDRLSGGWRRRVLLARALVAESALLLLDEPTNHLDIEAITWLETHLADYAGTIVFVTHDRQFLQRLATRIVELDRGRLRSWSCDYATFLRRKEQWLAGESARQETFDRKLAGEEAWLRQGIRARRTRNQGRVRALAAMRAARAARRPEPGRARLRLETADPSGRMVYEAKGVSKSFDGVPVVRDFSARIMRGDRIGLIGPNGAGKTTLLRLLMGELEPDAGAIRRGTNVRALYYDQQREQLDPERTVADTVGDGSDTVTVNGRSRHVHGYLADFLFSPGRARSPVRALSGGERNRLLLARLLARPANVLVLDEPTNDLDLETLELLEAMLTEFAGTVLLVSHDRAFLDNVVTSTYVFEGDGLVGEYVGGIGERAAPEAAPEAAPQGAPPTRCEPAGGGPPGAKRKLSYNEQRELDALPGRIGAMEDEQQRLHSDASRPDFYREDPATIRRVLERLEALQGDLLAAYARWDALDSLGRRLQEGPGE